MEGEPAGILLQGLATPGQHEHREMPGEVLRARGMPGRCETGLPWGSSQGCCCLILSYFWAGEHLQLGLSALSPAGLLGSSLLSGQEASSTWWDAQPQSQLHPLLGKESWAEVVRSAPGPAASPEGRCRAF